MRVPFDCSWVAVRAVITSLLFSFIAALIGGSIISTISTRPALAQAKPDWTPPIPPEILPQGKNPAPPKLKKAKCPTCQQYLDELQAALQDWYVLQYIDGEKNYNKANNPEAGEEKDANGAKDAQSQMDGATASLGGKSKLSPARDTHNQKVKGNEKTGTKPDPDAGDKDKLAQRIKDLVNKYENCERHPPPECRPPPPPETKPQTPQVPKQPENPPPPPPPPPPKGNVKLPEVPNCFPNSKAKSDKVQELNDLIVKLKDAYNRLGKPRANDPTKIDPPDPDDPAAKQAQADIDAANALLKKAQDAKDDGCPPPSGKTGTGTGTGNGNVGLPWQHLYDTHDIPSMSLDTEKNDDPKYPRGSPVKAPPVRYVKVCSLYGQGFYYIPGTDTCIKIGGYVRQEGIDWSKVNYTIDKADINDCGYKCFRGSPVRAWDYFPQTFTTPGSDERKAYDTIRSYFKGVQNANTDNGLDKSLYPWIEGYGQDRLKRLWQMRTDFLYQWQRVSPELQKFFDYHSTLGVLRPGRSRHSREDVAGSVFG